MNQKIIEVCIRFWNRNIKHFINYFNLILDYIGGLWYLRM